MEDKLTKILEAHKLPTIFSYRRACEAGMEEAVKILRKLGWDRAADDLILYWGKK